MSAKQCHECGGIGHHVVNCGEADAEWVGEQNEWPEDAPEIESCPFNAIEEIVSNLVANYGRASIRNKVRF